MPLNYDQLAARVQQGLDAVYLFGGVERLLLEECRDLVFAKARAEGFSERELIEADARFDWDQLDVLASAGSLFSPRRIIDLRLPTGKPGIVGSKRLVEWASDADPDLLLVVSCDLWDKSSRNSKWARVLEQAGTRVDIWQVKAAELPRWIKQRMEAVGLEPDRDAVLAMANRLEGNLLAARQEIEKLVLIKGPGPVGAEDVLRSVADSTRFDAFLLVERILAGNLPESLRVASGLQRSGVAIQMVTGAVVRELRTLEAYILALRAGEPEAGVFRRLNVWRPRQPALRAAAQRIRPVTLARAFQQLSLLDRQSKGRADGDPWHGLNQLAISLCA